MCLAIPGRVVRWIDRDPVGALAEIEFGGITRPCHMACVLDASLGDYVVVHAGVAIAIIDTAAAEQTLADLKSLPRDAADWPDEMREEGAE